MIVVLISRSEGFLLASPLYCGMLVSVSIPSIGQIDPFENYL